MRCWLLILIVRALAAAASRDSVGAARGGAASQQPASAQPGPLPRYTLPWMYGGTIAPSAMSLSRCNLRFDPSSGSVQASRLNESAEELPAPLCLDDAVCQVCVSPDYRLLAAGSEAGEILVVDLASGSQRRLDGHAGGTMALAWARPQQAHHSLGHHHPAKAAEPAGGVQPPQQHAVEAAGWGGKQAQLAYVSASAARAQRSERFCALRAVYGNNGGRGPSEAGAAEGEGWVLVSSGGDGCVRAWAGGTGQLLCVTSCGGAGAGAGVRGSAGAWIMNVDAYRLPHHGACIMHHSSSSMPWALGRALVSTLALSTLALSTLALSTLALSTLALSTLALSTGQPTPCGPTVCAWRWLQRSISWVCAAGGCRYHGRGLGAGGQPSPSRALPRIGGSVGGERTPTPAAAAAAAALTRRHHGAVAVVCVHPRRAPRAAGQDRRLCMLLL
jgi:hypothetical protein